MRSVTPWLLVHNINNFQFVLYSFDFIANTNKPSLEMGGIISYVLGRVLGLSLIKPAPPNYSSHFRRVIQEVQQSCI